MVPTVTFERLFPDTRRALTVSVIGGREASVEALATAEETGRLLGQAGAALVCGGGPGIMAAACRGAKSAGGLTIGILPGPDAAEANEWVDIAIPTAMSHARNVLVVKSGSAVIAFPGGHGTLSEIAHALNEGIPVVSLGEWAPGQGGAAIDGVAAAGDPADAVAQAITAARRRRPAQDTSEATRDG